MDESQNSISPINAGDYFTEDNDEYAADDVVNEDNPEGIEEKDETEGQEYNDDDDEYDDDDYDDE